MNASLPEVLIFTPTPNEYLVVNQHLSRCKFRNFNFRVIESGLGKINATFKMTAETLAVIASGRRPAFLIGVGTSGSLDLKLGAGDLIASASAVISDWRMEDGQSQQYGCYNQLVYHHIEPQVAESMALNCLDPTVTELMKQLGGLGFKSGRMMTSDTFVAGRDHKLKLGRQFNCLACDMESGAFAYTAQNLLGGLAWFNLRVVADTLDETLGDYFNKEIDMAGILGEKTALALSRLDELLAVDN